MARPRGRPIAIVVGGTAMLHLTTDTDLDLVLLPHITIMLLIGQVVRHLFGWLGLRRWPQSGVIAA